MQPTSNSQWLTPQFATVIASNIGAILLAKGIVTPSIADAINNNTAVIGSIIILVVMNGLYLFGSIAHSLRYGSPPSLPQVAPDSLSPSAASGPASPSYGPPSTGSDPVAISLPAELAGVI
jgi:hypothetical protein